MKGAIANAIATYLEYSLTSMSHKGGALHLFFNPYSVTYVQLREIISIMFQLSISANRPTLLRQGPGSRSFTVHHSFLFSFKGAASFT
jgi:hypothetical protein